MSASKNSGNSRGDAQATASKETIRKCLLRYVDNILCLDDIQGVVSLHQLGLLPREDMSSYLDGSSGGSKSRGGGPNAEGPEYSPSKGHPRRSIGSLEDQMELPGWEFLEGMLSGDADKHHPIHSLCASLTGMAVSGYGVPELSSGAGHPMSSSSTATSMTTATAMTMTRAPRGSHASTSASSLGAFGAVPMSGLPPALRSSLSPVNVNARNSDGESALTFALNNEQLEMITILVEKGKADVNLQNKDGNTELMMAARRGQTKMVKLLVEALGANVHLRNKEGMTALMVAEKYERTEIVRFLAGALRDRKGTPSSKKGKR